MKMKNKKILIGILALILVFGMTGTKAFAQEHKHNPFDVLVGLNWGFGVTPNFFGLFGHIANGEIPKGSYAFTFDFGATGDFYILYWLSVNSGILLHSGFYAFFDNVEVSPDLKFTDIMSLPLYMTIPITMHFNIPRVEWLYMGTGVNLNIPLYDFLSPLNGGDTKVKFFVGLPIDLGFDFMKRKGGMRLFFRVTPEFHEKGIPVPIGLVWQIWNWKVFGK